MEENFQRNLYLGGGFMGEWQLEAPFFGGIKQYLGGGNSTIFLFSSPIFGEDFHFD